MSEPHEIDDGDDARMPFLEHLRELRDRLRNSVIALIIGFFGAYSFKEDLFVIMVKPLLPVLKRMHEDPSTIDRATAVLSASRNLERIADQATNIAEDLLFMVHGEISRHKHRSD